ncbi:MAG: hypothetical protein IJJ13_03200 [Lachnospiraceae bacterium]|nr:hypothetical protein [Lachnospiraceae bacterium]
MTASADMISKINSLGQSDFTLVVNLVDFLAKEKDPSEENVFAKAREACKDHWKDEEQLEEMVDSVKDERHASCN